MKISIWWVRNSTFDKGGCKFIKRDFSGGEKSKFWLLDGILPPSTGFPTKVQKRVQMRRRFK